MIREEKKEEVKDKVKGLLYVLASNDKLTKSYGTEEERFLNQVKSKKTGKEIKGNLLNLILSLNDRKATIREHILSCVRELGEQPKEFFRSKENDSFLYKYAYEQIYNEQGMYHDKERGKKMNRYNSLLFDLIHYELLIRKLQKAIEFINDKETYLITPGMAVKLGI